MAARKMNPYRHPRYLHIFRQAACDVADAKVGELSFSLRGKVLNTPDDWEDMPLSRVRKLYELDSDNTMTAFDSRNKINRLRLRRQARKLAA